eukprot:6173895-Pleurochrysis_carterae.AAC.4
MSAEDTDTMCIRCKTQRSSLFIPSVEMDLLMANERARKNSCLGRHRDTRHDFETGLQAAVAAHLQSGSPQCGACGLGALAHVAVVVLYADQAHGRSVTPALHSSWSKGGSVKECFRT